MPHRRSFFSTPCLIGRRVLAASVYWSKSLHVECAMAFWSARSFKRNDTANVTAGIPIRLLYSSLSAFVMLLVVLRARLCLCVCIYVCILVLAFVCLSAYQVGHQLWGDVCVYNLKWGLSYLPPPICYPRCAMCNAWHTVVIVLLVFINARYYYLFLVLVLFERWRQGFLLSGANEKVGRRAQVHIAIYQCPLSDAWLHSPPPAVSLLAFPPPRPLAVLPCLAFHLG